jgi:hypothetical protein
VVAVGHNSESFAKLRTSFRNQRIDRVGQKFVSFPIRCCVLSDRKTFRENSQRKGGVAIYKSIYFFQPVSAKPYLIR